MDFGLSPDQTLLVDTVHRVLGTHAALERVRAYAADNTDKGEDIWRELTLLGLPGLVIVEAHGGSGLGMLEAALVAECLGAHVAPVPFVSSCVLAPLALMQAGSPEQQGTWLPRIAQGKTRIGFAASEHGGARENAGVIARDGRLYGRALFVLDFAADSYLIADSAGGLHLIEAAASGLLRRELVTVDRTRQIGELVFDAVFAEPLVGSANGLVLEQLLDCGRVLFAADTLGAAQHMLDAAVAYAGQREQFGRVIGSFQAVKHLCAEMAAALEPCRAMVWYAAYVLDALPDEAHVTACHTKAHVADVGTFVAKTATEVHGGVGFTDLLGLHYWFKRIGLDRQLLGGPERMRHLAAVAQGLG